MILRTDWRVEGDRGWVLVDGETDRQTGINDEVRSREKERDTKIERYIARKIDR